MAILWGGKGEAMASELKDIEVDEVSLVDRPATGRRFVLFKRAGRLRGAPEEKANKCSDNAPEEPPLDALRKRADAVQDAVDHLAEQAARLEERLRAVESAHPGRQSEEAAAHASCLWRGVL